MKDQRNVSRQKEQQKALEKAVAKAQAEGDELRFIPTVRWKRMKKARQLRELGWVRRKAQRKLGILKP
jgi:hypothetical protein